MKILHTLSLATLVVAATLAGCGQRTSDTGTTSSTTGSTSTDRSGGTMSGSGTTAPATPGSAASR